MSLYESVIIVRQDVTATQVDALADSFNEIISTNGGSIERREYWGLRTLAYRIKKNRKGHYVFLNIDSPPDAVQEMERNMRLNEDILRFLTVRIDEIRAEPSPIMQGKGDRERERADRSQRHGGGRGRDDRGVRGDRGDRRERNEPAGGGAAKDQAADSETPAAGSGTPAAGSAAPAADSEAPAAGSEAPAASSEAQADSGEAPAAESKED